MIWLMKEWLAYLSMSVETEDHQCPCKTRWRCMRVPIFTHFKTYFCIVLLNILWIYGAEAEVSSTSALLLKLNCLLSWSWSVFYFRAGCGSNQCYNTIWWWDTVVSLLLVVPVVAAPLHNTYHHHLRHMKHPQDLRLVNRVTKINNFDKELIEPKGRGSM